MGTEAPSSVWPGLDHASPVLLELLHRITDEIANHPLLKEEEPLASAGDAIEVEPALTTATKDTKTAAGAQSRTRKDHPDQVDRTAAQLSSTEPEHAAAAAPETACPVVEDTFDQQIKAVQAKAEEDLKASMELEQYLIEQHAAVERATAADMAAKDQQYTRFWRYTGVPHAPAKLELDSARIRAAGLLDTTAVLQELRDAQQKTVLSPPITKAFSDNSALPHYLANTAAQKNRESGRQDAIARCRKSITEGKAFTWHSLPKEQVDAAYKASRRRQKLSSLRMNGDQWDAERRVIQRIQEKLNFTRNPRFQDTVQQSEIPAIRDPLLSRPKFGVGLVNMRTNTKPRLTSRPHTSFVCEPACVEFAEWQPGTVYEAVVQIRNVAATLQRVRVLPATTQYFHISRLTLPATEGVIAPGVHGEVRVKFTPDSLANFSDKMTVSTEKGDIVVPLIAHRTPPVLEMEGQLSLGAVYVGNGVKRQIVVRAKHGKGVFRVVSSRTWASQGRDIHLEDVITLPGGFTVTPAEFSLAAGDAVTLDVSFTPAAQGLFEASYLILCDNCHHRENTVTGRGVEPDASVVSFDGKPYNHAAGAIQFPSTMPGSCTTRTLSVRNACGASLPFRWVVSNSVQQASSSAQTPGTMMLRPEQGVMAPQEEMLFDVVFSPTSHGIFASAANFEMDPSAVSDVFGEPKATVRRLQLHFQGCAPVHPAAVYPRTLRAPEELEVGSTFTQSFIITNPAVTAAKFRISGATKGPVVVSVEQGIVAPRSEEVIHVLASACEAADLQHTLQCHIEHGLVYAVQVQATFARYLPVQLLSAGIDFGVVPRGTSVVATLQLRNPSVFNAAPWSVSCVAPAVHTVATVEAPVSRGALQPKASGAVQLQCTGVAAGALHGHADVRSHGAVMLVPFRARVVAPRIALGPATDDFDLGTTYLGVPVTRSMELINDTEVEAHWRLRSQVLGTGADTVQVQGQPDSGMLGPRARQTMSVTVAPQHVGSLDGLIVLDVDHAEHPVAVPISCCSESLRVEYSILHGRAEGNIEHGATDALTSRVISFGECIMVGDVVTLQLTLTNPTGIEAPVALSLDHFAAADDSIRSPERTQTTSGSMLTGGGKLCGRRSGLLLGDEHEQTAPFRSKTGKELVATRAVQKAAQALLVDRGIAIKLSATEAVLPAFGRCRFELQLVHVQREAAFISGLHKQVCTTTRIDFGSVPRDIHVNKSFFIFNQSSFDVEINFGVHVWEKRPGAPLVDVDLAVQADGQVTVSARARTTTAEEYASFTVQPQCVQLAPGVSQKVTVYFSSPLAVHHEGFVLGTQQLRYNAESTTTATILSHAETQPPEARLEHGQRQPLDWVIHSIHGPRAGSRQRTVTFCNRTASPLRFHMNTEGPFEVMNVVTSVPQEPHMYIGSKCFVPPDGDSGSTFLPPQESVDVMLMCVLAVPEHSAQDSSASGVLRLWFSNGQVQEEDLTASMLHPRLQCKGKGGAMIRHLDFGRVALRSCRVLQVVLENPSTVDAVWSAAVCEADATPAVMAANGLAKSNACNGAQGDAENTDDSVTVHVFSATPGRGLLHGSPPERPSAQAVLIVNFSPDAVGEFSAEVHFMTKGGNPCSLTVKGTATLDERDEPNWKQTELFQ